MIEKTMENMNFAEPFFPSANHRRPHVMVFTSGKGGVGKTCVATNVATALAQNGARVCIFDADTGLANINILLGLRPEFTLEHVLKGQKAIKDIVIKTRQGVGVVPGASGVAELANLDAARVKRLCAALTELEAEYDYFLIDTAAGVADNVLQFIESAPYTFLLITPEPTSLTDAFSLLKLLNGRGYGGRLRVIVNMAVDYPQASETYRRFATAVEKYLELKVEYGGFVARDELLPRSVVQQTPLVELSSNSPAARCLLALADNVLKHIGAESSETGLADYWKTLLSDLPETELPSANHEVVISAETEAGQALPETLSGQALTDLASQLLSAMTPSTDASDLETFIADFFEAFVKQFGHFPQAFKPLLFRWLEAENYAEPRLLELTGTLEALYMTKHRQPMYSLDSMAARMLAQCQGDRARMQDMVYQLRKAYRQMFQADVFDARQEVLDGILQDDFSEEDFQRLLDALSQTFEKRFKRRYQGQSDLLLESTADTLIAIADDEETLQQQIQALSHGFQQLGARREALLTAIRHGQQGNLSFEAKTSVQD